MLLKMKTRSADSVREHDAATRKDLICLRAGYGEEFDHLSTALLRPEKQPLAENQPLPEKDGT